MPSNAHRFQQLVSSNTFEAKHYTDNKVHPS